MKRHLFTLGIFLAVMTLCGASEAVEQPRPLPPIETENLPREIGEPKNLLDFFNERTKIGYGFEETYNDNLLLQRDRQKQDEFISTLEGEIFFADPRGSLLYGADWEINAFRYHHKSLNAINHDANVFLNLDPGGRYKYGFQYKLGITNTLVFGPEQIDILRQSGKFQRLINHNWSGKLTYALNNTNNLVPQVEYELFDDQSLDNANTDRNQLRLILDIDHDLRPQWIIFSGYEFGDVKFPKNDLKDEQINAFRLGTRYELTKIVDLNLLAKLEQHEFKNARSNNLSFEGKWTYQPGSRTTLSLKASDGKSASYSANRLQFRSTGASGEIRYELTPLTQLTAGAGFESQRSDVRDAVPGTTAQATKSSRYSFGAGMLWNFRQNAHVELSFAFNRSKTSDYTSRITRVAIEATF